MKNDPTIGSLAIREQSSDERRVFLQAIQTMMLDGRLTMGAALRVLRAAHLGVTRKQYARMVKLSNTALADLENDRGNPTMRSIEQAFRPFGFRLALIPVAGSAVSLTPDTAPDDALAGAILDAVGKRPG